LNLQDGLLRTSDRVNTGFLNIVAETRGVPKNVENVQSSGNVILSWEQEEGHIVSVNRNPMKFLSVGQLLQQPSLFSFGKEKAKNVHD
jgi:hypothetical protein